MLRELEQLYRRRYRAFLRVALAELGDREAAHDAVQETFARALRSRRSYRGEGTLEAWVWRTLANHCLDVRRRRAAAPPELAPAEDAVNGHPLEHADLRALVAALPERQRLVLFLRHYADLDYDAIATALGIERGTVAATLHRARAALRDELERAPR